MRANRAECLRDRLGGSSRPSRGFSLLRLCFGDGTRCWRDRGGRYRRDSHEAGGQSAVLTTTSQ